MCSFMVMQLCYLPTKYFKKEINSGEHQFKPTMAVWNKVYLINSISVTSFCILIVLRQALASWLETWLVRSGLFCGFVKSQSVRCGVRLYSLFQQRVPAKRPDVTSVTGICFWCALVALGVGTAHGLWALSLCWCWVSNLLEFWASAWIFKSSLFQTRQCPKKQIS